MSYLSDEAIERMADWTKTVAKTDDDEVAIAWIYSHYPEPELDDTNRRILAFLQKRKEDRNNNTYTLGEAIGMQSTIQDEEIPAKKSSDIPVMLGVVEKLNEDLHAINQQPNHSLTDVFSAFGNAFNAFKGVPSSEKEVLLTESGQIASSLPSLGIQSKTDEIITVGSVVVTYRPNILNIRESERRDIRNVFRAVLNANPNADLNAIQDSIGVKILNVQRPTPPKTLDRGFGSFNG